MDELSEPFGFAHLLVGDMGVKEYGVRTDHAGAVTFVRRLGHFGSGEVEHGWRCLFYLYPLKMYKPHPNLTGSPDLASLNQNSRFYGQTLSNERRGGGF